MKIRVKEVTDCLSRRGINVGDVREVDGEPLLYEGKPFYYSVMPDRPITMYANELEVINE